MKKLMKFMKKTRNYKMKGNLPKKL